MPQNGTLATILAIVSVALGAGAILYALLKYFPRPAAFPGAVANEQRTKGLELRVEFSSKLFDLSLLLLGAIWGLVLADKVSIHFQRWQETVLFSTSNFLLVLSMFFHLSYRLRLANMIWDLAPNAPPVIPALGGPAGNAADAPQLPDIRNTFVEFPLTTQWALFFAALASGFFTILVAKVFGG